MLLPGWAWALGALAALAVVFGESWRARELPATDLPRRARVLAALAVVCAALGAGWPALDSDFLGDDFGYVRLFDGKPLRSFLRLGDVSEGIWGQPLDELRPLFALSFKLGLLLHGPQARALLAGNLALHAACSLLVYLLARRLAGRLRTALGAGLIFALMPVHAEPLGWITGRVDSLPTLFYLGCVLLFARFRARAERRAWAAAVALYALGVFSKEILVTLPALLLAYDALLAGALRGPGAWRARLAALARVHAPFALIAALFLILRRLVFDSFAREGRFGAALMQSFLAQQPGKARALLLPWDAWRAQAEATGSAPFGLAPETFATAIGALLLGALAGLAIVAARAWRTQAPALVRIGFFGGLWYAITVLPLMVTYSSARHLYLPSCGTAIALALLLFPPLRGGATRAGPARVATLALLLGLHALLLRAGLREWAAAGEMSRLARAGISAICADLPAGATLVLTGVPATPPRVMGWRYALPFALEPPYVARASCAPHALIAPPGLDSQPQRDWWRRTRGLLATLFAGPAEERVSVRVLRWNARQGELRAHVTRPTRGLLAAQARQALGAAPDETLDLGSREGERLVRALAEGALRARP